MALGVPSGFLGLIASFVGLSKFVQNGTGVGLVAFLAVLPILYTILRAIFGRISASESTKLQHVVDKLARLTEGSAD